MSGGEAAAPGGPEPLAVAEPGRAAVWLALGYAARSLAYAGIVVILGRLFGPADFGAISLFLAFSAGIAYLAGSWPFLAIPLLAAEGGRIEAVAAATIRIALAGAAVVAVLFLPAQAVMRDDADPVLAVVTLAYAAGLLGLSAVYAVYQTLGAMSSIATAQTAERLVGVVALGALALVGTSSVRAAEAALAVSALLLLAGVVLALRRRGVRLTLRRQGDAPPFRLVLGRVGPMVVVTVTAYLVAWMDLFFVGAFRDADEVGHYALAYQLFTLVIQFAALWVTAALPYQLRHAKSGGGAADRASLVWSTAAWSAAVAAVAVAGQWVVVPVMGEEFEPAVAPSALLLIAATAVSGYYAAVPRVLARQGARDVARVSAVGFVINLVLDLALIPWLGGWGAVIATGVTLFYATAALVAVDAGWRTSLTVMAAGLPAAAAIGLSVAADTPAVQGVVLAALLAGLAFSAHCAWRQRRTTTATETETD